MRGFLIDVASLIADLVLWGAQASVVAGMGSVIAAHGLVAPQHMGIFPDQGSNLSPALACRFLTTGPPEKSSSDKGNVVKFLSSFTAS